MASLEKLLSQVEAQHVAYIEGHYKDVDEF